MPEITARLAAVRCGPDSDMLDEKASGNRVPGGSKSEFLPGYQVMEAS